eukprot:TRINITY_DN5052_c0_g1_i4.p3 TRINITY_DN5052_c0_g1~~TRINITY_DN5052_c0_g1_i4.p3  ORF type:complete len:108 (+),score=0.54 TRINITY_DN5052_c0_g1_i4:282-605(+)
MPVIRRIIEDWEQSSFTQRTKICSGRIIIHLPPIAKNIDRSVLWRESVDGILPRTSQKRPKKVRDIEEHIDDIFVGEDVVFFAEIAKKRFYQRRGNRSSKMHQFLIK